ncbi:MAG: hypothetical protein COV45_06110 [Deltaproteobacteria bacterium CG11_big_fil_rev_8_21_14_0_20_47_16]|nr:MAG: hypothetical protein COV45_06110 [Deltaproteobacteria bacterium CG11_big_fil_rev_8_21_14_0_20_47_16]
MILKIEQDLSRFKEIVRGRIKKDLQKFITKTELIGKKGKDLVSIPIPQIEIPRFIFGDNQKNGVGQGEGEAGEGVGQEGGAGAKAGDAEGQHMMEVELSFEELAQILGETLELPKIQPKGENELSTERPKYTGIGMAGPESLRHFKRTYRQALRRQIASGTYDPKNPIIIPVREDRRYRMWKQQPKQECKAVIIYMMDVSGSMGNEQKEIVRLEAFWIDTWLRSQYSSIEMRYIIHDAVAREVDRETFFHTRESGGTIISSAYKMCVQMIHEKYNPADWNIYPFHFSDGDNWSANDTEECLTLLKNEILPASNVFCYGQVESEYGSGQFLKDLNEKLKDDEQLITSRIPNKDAIPSSIKDFLGKGK